MPERTGHKGDDRKDPGRSAPAPARPQARQRILDAAQQLFALQGFDATKTKQIARQAEVPEGLIFYYFSGKRKLLEDLVNERNFLGELEAILRSAPPGDPRRGLLDLGQRFLDVVRRREAVARILLRESQTQPPVAERWREIRESAIAIITQYLQRAIPQRSVAGVDPESVARIFLYNLIFVALIDDLRDPERFLADMVEVLRLGALPGGPDPLGDRRSPGSA